MLRLPKKKKELIRTFNPFYKAGKLFVNSSNTLRNGRLFN